MAGLQIERPTFDVSKPILTAQQIQQNTTANALAAMRLKNYPTDHALDEEAARQSNQLRALGLTEATGQAAAQADYRAAVNANDPNAIDKLKAYPELQLKVKTTMDALKPDDRKLAAERAAGIAETVRYAYTLPKGPQRDAAWAAAMDAIAKKGLATPEQAATWKKNGPDDSFAANLLTTDDLIKQYLNPKALTWDQLSLSDRLALSKEAHSIAATGISKNDTVDPDVMATRESNAWKQLWVQLGLSGDPPSIDQVDLLKKGAAAGKGDSLLGTTASDVPLTPDGKVGNATTEEMNPKQPLNKPWKKGDPLPATHAHAAHYEGDGSLADIQKWLDSLPSHVPVISPIDGSPQWTQ